MPLLLKIPALLPLLLAYLFTSGIIVLLPAGRRQRRHFLAANTSLFAGLLLRLCNVRVQVRHRERFHRREQGRLVVANHVSYVDVLVLAAISPSVFITSVELGSSLVLGILARLGGSLFVERRKVAGLKGEITAITDALNQGFAVTLFPEGTTSNGDRVHPFRNSLFTAALNAKVDILPVCLRYTQINDEPVTAATRDRVYYYGGATFLRHFGGFLQLLSVDVEVLPLQHIRREAPVSRKMLAAEAHALISDVYHARRPE